MKVKLSHSNQICKGELNITGSKSETNRLLFLQAVLSEFEIENISNSDDSKAMQAALTSNEKLIDIHHA